MVNLWHQKEKMCKLVSLKKQCGSFQMPFFFVVLSDTKSKVFFCPQLNDVSGTPYLTSLVEVCFCFCLLSVMIEL